MRSNSRKVKMEIANEMFHVEFLEDGKIIYYIMVDKVRQGEVSIIATIYDWIGGLDINHPELRIV